MQSAVACRTRRAIPTRVCDESAVLESQRAARIADLHCDASPPGIRRTDAASKLEVAHGRRQGVAIGHEARALGVDHRRLAELLIPELRVTPAIRPGNPHIQRARAGGVTTLFGIPGSGSSISGFGVLYKAKASESYQDIVLRDPGGMKVAQTHNPQRRNGDLGSTWCGLSWMLEEVNARAMEQGAEGNPRLEPLRRVQRGELPVLIHCAGNEGVASAVRMWKGRYGTRCIVSHGCFDGWMTAEYVARMGVPVSITLAGTTAAPPRTGRLTVEEIRRQRLGELRKRDPALDAAAEALDLEMTD